MDKVNQKFYLCPFDEDLLKYEIGHGLTGNELLDSSLFCNRITIMKKSFKLSQEARDGTPIFYVFESFYIKQKEYFVLREICVQCQDQKIFQKKKDGLFYEFSYQEKLCIISPSNLLPIIEKNGYIVNVKSKKYVKNTNSSYSLYSASRTENKFLDLVSKKEIIKACKDYIKTYTYVTIDDIKELDSFSKILDIFDMKEEAEKYRKYHYILLQTISSLKLDLSL
jgi:hypothetical protein